ncbi:hypothetical protein BFP72_17535 [Reichenbachiella sp. 5M10]|uniref:hypothetical protein n=1 Tax=Reichenbachiella sp. 5M10 TaxID=1889772 RepID=UPI000C14A375|nr:hypothetical protein [Reichenbachiella sp. 5M10]PIB37077.1 hypothetical protein BFP72_17535 [Reichenbachiella sp. 5M10]
MCASGVARLQAQIIQDKATYSIDSIRIRADRFLFLGDDVFYIQRDTVIAIPDTVDFFVRKQTLEKSDVFYDSVKEKMSRNKMSSMVYDAVFKSTAKGKVHGEGFSEFRFVPYEYAVVSPLEYKHLDIFGSSMNDTTKHNVDRYTNILNKLHVHTQRWVVRRNLTFRAGDYVEAQKMIDSERLLRSRAYIRDARIMIDTGVGDSMRTEVVTRDVFPYAVSIRPNNNNRALFGVKNVNIAGFGHEVEYNFIDDGGTEFFYRANNLFASYLDMTLDVATYFRKEGIGIFANRPFVTQNTKYAGGMELSRYQFGEYAYDPYTDVTDEFFYDRDRFGIWLARSFALKKTWPQLGFSKQMNFVISAGYDTQDYYNRPVVTADSNYIYQDRNTYLVEWGLTSRNYFRDRYVLNYGRTEDIPTGSVAGVITGYQEREFVNRYYLGLNYARGGYIKSFGYLNTTMSVGSFFDKGKLADGVGYVGVDYFSDLFRLGRFRFRQFVNMSYSQAINPTEDIFIQGQNELGLSNVSGYYLKATSKFNLKAEPVMFTPFNIFSFRMAFFTFGQATMVTNSKNGFFEREVFSEYGLGVTFNNDNFAISTITVRFAYFHNTPINANTKPASVSTSGRLRIRDFDIESPELIQFR